MCKSCKDPAGCARKAERWERNRNGTLHIGESLLEELRGLRAQGINCIKQSWHEEVRKIERCISDTEIRLLIDRDAWPFQYYEDAQGTEKLCLVGFVRSGGKSYRPIHIILKRNKGEWWNIVTVYDPRSEGFRWTGNYQTRICFCR